ncbi:hypothetical protein FG386_002763 [Cryptosporidium ryanae]|uniref:uncharacterized protein n=1 Tax=Cryptosporidium ryanae TaxID=515981 RepID=UPI00351A3D39|nr:hypothetical protein FG386_002763 [Cryptosporidium ryanae]
MCRFLLSILVNILFANLTLFAQVSKADVSEQLVTYGSTLLLVNIETSSYLYSSKITWSNGNQVATCSKEYESENYFYLREGSEVNDYKGAGYPVMCGETIKLLHANTEKYLSANASSRSMVTKQIEAFCGPKDKTSLFTIECEKSKSGEELRIGDQFKLFNIETKSYLVSSRRSIFDNRNCPRCPIVGQYEVSLNKKCKGDGLWTFKGILVLHSSGDGSRTSVSTNKDEL